MNKKIAIAFVLMLAILGCTSPMYVEGKKYQSFGFLNEEAERSDEVCYDISPGNLFWGIISVDTILGPINFLGLDLFEPTRMKKGADDDCASDK